MPPPHVAMLRGGRSGFELSGALMPNAHRPCSAAIASWGRLCAAATFAVFITGSTALTQNARVEDLVSAVVRIKTHVNPEGRTVEGLGREREGSGIIIDNDGLVLTIGYLMVEAYAAEVVDNSGRTVPANVVGYDHESGFGLLRTMEPLKLKPMSQASVAPTWWPAPTSSPSESSLAIGNTCSMRRCSPRRRIRPGAGRR
jgi:S1-C subfamily serine protease